MTSSDASMVEPLIEESIEIAAPPVRVWAFISDLTKMSQWSPQVAKSFTKGPVRLGSKLVNINKDGFKVWPTRSKVIRFDPHREIAFRIKDNKAIWSFTLEPTATGTRLVERREVPDGITDISAKLTDRFFGGQEGMTKSLRAGMQQTLERVKAEVESA